VVGAECLAPGELKVAGPRSDVTPSRSGPPGGPLAGRPRRTTGDPGGASRRYVVSETNYNGGEGNGGEGNGGEGNGAAPVDEVRDAIGTGGRRPPSTPAVEDELATRLRVAVTRLNRKLRQQSLAGLSPAQATALGSVSRLGCPTLGELAAAEQVQPPTMTKLMASMEASGLVARVADEADGRISRVRLTAEGRRTLHRIRSLKNAYLARHLSRLSAEDRAVAERLTLMLEQLVEQP
jgi:DNA-binding MarR family transcriptional regulator